MSKNIRSQIWIAGIISLVLLLAFLSGSFGVFRDKLIDLLFTQKSASKDILIVAIDEASIQSIGQWPWPRSVFGRALAGLDGSRVVGIDVNFKENSGRGMIDDDYFVDAMRSSSVRIVISSEIRPDGNIILPLEKFRVDSLQGFANVSISPDGVVRRVKLRSDSNSSFALLIGGLFDVDISDYFSDYSEAIRINYRGKDGTFAKVSFKDVLENKIPASFLKDKIILIGATAIDLHDYHQTPVGLMSGVELQANAIQTILDRAIFTSSDLIDALVTLVLICFSVFLAFRIKSLAKLIVASILLLAIYNLAAFMSFDGFFVLDIFYPNLAIILAIGASISFQYVSTHKEKKFIQESFSRYLAPEVVGELIKDPSRLKLGGERKNITILFSDIRGFTSISEKMSPEQLTSFMNRYLSAMAEVVFRHGGVVDKYIGDAVMAFWGAPVADEKHALHGVLTALDMMSSLNEVNRKNKELGEPEINIGVGLNSGDVTVGNMGSERRFNYTVLGDNVNLASRLEGLNKNYETNIIISQATLSMLDQDDIKKYDIEFREIGDVQVKGKEIATKIYEIKNRTK
ncbi:MAG: adenylate/guanylate cyclase domain-containing protein [Patescibacteria group bacterium]